MMTRTATALTAAVVLVLAVVAVLVVRSREEPPPRLGTVFMGDSITWADSATVEGLPGEGSWVRWAVDVDGSPWAFEADVAVPGETLAQMAARFDSDVVARRPQAVVIMGGTNDALQGLPVDASAASLRQMVVAARGAGARVWVVGPPPVDPGYGRSVGPLAAAERQVAEASGATYVRVDDPRLTGPTGAWLPGLSWDGVHPTPAGARALAAVVLDGVG